MLPPRHAVRQTSHPAACEGIKALYQSKECCQQSTSSTQCDELSLHDTMQLKRNFDYGESTIRYNAKETFHKRPALATMAANVGKVLERPFLCGVQGHLLEE